LFRMPGSPPAIVKISTTNPTFIILSIIYPNI
ncbi:MAG: hypothetical protein ACI9IA_002351, partial [Enterobacterales bacterium]